MDWTTLFQQFMNGFSLGSLYALLAIGYTLVYGILGLINFAHSDVFMLGTYFAFFMMGIFLLPWWLSVVIGVSLCALVGMTIERVAYRPLRSAPRISALITAVGVSFFIQNLGLITVGARPKGFPRPELMKNVYFIAGVRIQGVTFWVPLFSIAILSFSILLHWVRLWQASGERCGHVSIPRLILSWVPFQVGRPLQRRWWEGLVM
jgi:branched-chain amino acid transport system permease protein